MRVKSYIKTAWLHTKLRHLAQRPTSFSQGRPTVIGFMSAPTGLGFGARLIFNALEQYGYNPNSIDISEYFFSDNETLQPFSLNNNLDDGPLIFHVNPVELPQVIDLIGPEHIKLQKIIAVWAWEQKIVPHSWVKTQRFVDEVWASSRFLEQTFRSQLSKPVFYTAYPIVENESNTQKSKSNPRKPLKILTAFDPKSGLERKNPEAAIQAFKEAFGDDEDVELTIKIPAPDWLAPNTWNDLKNVKIINCVFSDQEMDASLSEYDCVISLHRSEGFGFLIATALAKGIPTIFTEGFGCDDFSSCPGAYVVPGKPYTIQDKATRYKTKHGNWVEPDVLIAETYLKQINDLSLEQQNQVSKEARLWWQQNYTGENFISRIPKNTKALFHKQ